MFLEQLHVFYNVWLGYHIVLCCQKSFVLFPNSCDILCYSACAWLRIRFSLIFRFLYLHGHSTIFCRTVCILVFLDHKKNLFHLSIRTLSRAVVMSVLYLRQMGQGVLSFMSSISDKCPLLVLAFNFLMWWLISFFRSTLVPGFYFAGTNKTDISSVVHLV